MAMAERTTDIEEPLEFEIDPALQAELHDHPGEWVTMTRRRLIAHGSSPAEVLKKAADEGVRSPILYRVPTAEEASAFFF